jgi:hypothetical protein
MKTSSFTLTAAALVLAGINLNGQCGISGNTLFVKTQGGLEKLSQCDCIHGSLWIEGGEVTSLDPLKKVSKIEENLTIYNNNSLTDMSGMQSLKTVGGDLIISANFALESLDGLASLTTVGGKLELSTNVLLNDLDGLHNVSHIGGDFLLKYNTLLSRVNMTSLKSVEGSVMIIGPHSHLTSLKDWTALNTVGGSLVIQGRRLNNLMGFQNLTSVGENLIISGTGVLSNVNGLNALTEVGGSVMITDNASLINLNGLESLSHVGEDLIVKNNGILSACCSLARLMDAGQVTGSITITGNSYYCNTEDEILELCLVDDDELNLGSAVIYHPTSGKVTIQGMKNPVVRLYDTSGNEIWRARQTEMDMNNQEAGLYMLHVTDAETGMSMQRKIQR